MGGYAQSHSWEDMLSMSDAYTQVPWPEQSLGQAERSQAAPSNCGGGEGEGGDVRGQRPAGNGRESDAHPREALALAGRAVAHAAVGALRPAVGVVLVTVGPREALLAQALGGRKQQKTVKRQQTAGRPHHASPGCNHWPSTGRSTCTCHTDHNCTRNTRKE